MYSSLLVPFDLTEPGSWQKSRPVALKTAGSFGASVTLVHVISELVLASHRPRMKDYLIDENAERVVRHAPCSVLVVRE